MKQHAFIACLLFAVQVSNAQISCIMTHEEGSHANYPNMAVNIVGSAVNRPTIVLADHTAAFNGTNPQAVFHYMTDQTLQNPWNDKKPFDSALGERKF